MSSKSETAKLYATASELSKKGDHAGAAAEITRVAKAEFAKLSAQLGIKS